MKLRQTTINPSKRGVPADGLLYGSIGATRASSTNRHLRQGCRGGFETARKTILPSVLIVLFCVCFLPYESAAAVFTVNTTSDTIVPNACLNSSTGCSLRGAITQANTTADTDFIEFNIPANDPFCTAGVCTINLNSRLPTIGTNMRITGPGADKLTVRNATPASGAVFHMQMSGPGTVFQIFSLTISGGDTNFGAGLLLVGDSSFVQARIIDCVITGNTATQQGGGIFNSHATTAIFNSLITGNAGGGIFNSAGVLTIINSTINGNTGKGIENDAGTVNLTNSTVSSNGGINSNGITNGGSGAVFNVKSSIIARNGGAFFSDISGAFVSAGFNLVGKRDAGTGFTAATDLTGTIDLPLDPRFDPGGLKNNGGTTKTITLMSGSPAIDKGSGNSLGGVLLELDQRGSPRRFDDPAVSNASGGDGTDIGALERRKSPYDFDGDGRTDISIFRPPPGEWWYLRSSTGGNGALQFGESTDKITPADFTGDGKTDIAFWRSSNGSWFVLRSEDFSFFGFPFGTAGDVPVPADFDGDGRSDPAVFRSSNATWFISQSNGGGTRILQFGLNGDKPVVADYDNDGRADVGIVRANGGAMEWWIQRSTGGLLALQFGVATDKAVQGDYTGDGKADVALWRPSTGEWFILRSEDLTFYGFPFGSSADVVAPGDYDGDGKFDATVFRPSNATWFTSRTTGAQFVQFGLNGDRPVPNAFIP